MKIEFYVTDCFIKDGKWIVEGRCFSGPIRLGDIFTLAYECEKEISIDPWQPGRQVNVKEVKLTVSDILCYGRSLADLESPYAASLILSGQGFEHLRSKVYLGS